MLTNLPFLNGHVVTVADFYLPPLTFAAKYLNRLDGENQDAYEWRLRNSILINFILPLINELSVKVKEEVLLIEPKIYTYVSKWVLGFIIKQLIIYGDIAYDTDTDDFVDTMSLPSNTQNTQDISDIEGIIDDGRFIRCILHGDTLIGSTAGVSPLQSVASLNLTHFNLSSRINNAVSLFISPRLVVTGVIPNTTVGSLSPQSILNLSSNDSEAYLLTADPKFITEAGFGLLDRMETTILSHSTRLIQKRKIVSATEAEITDDMSYFIPTLIAESIVAFANYINL